MDGPSRVSAPGPQASVRPRDGVVIVMGSVTGSFSGFSNVKGFMVGNFSSGIFIGVSSGFSSIVVGVVVDKHSTGFVSRPPPK